MQIWTHRLLFQIEELRKHNHQLEEALHSCDTEPRLDLDGLLEAFLAQTKASRATPIMMLENTSSFDQAKFFQWNVARSQPLLLKNAAKDLPALARWNDEYLRQQAGHHRIVAERSATSTFDPRGGFSQPENFTFSDFLANYKQSNLYFAHQPVLPELIGDLPAILPFAPFFRRISALIWFASGQTISRLHTDDFENVVIQVAGTKRFRLISPLERGYLYPTKERPNYSRIDPRDPDFSRFPLFKHAHVHDVLVEAGDMLYIPFGWWHHVESTGRSIAVTLFHDSACKVHTLVTDVFRSLDATPRRRKP
eukprot:CAMPEP_0175981298 /NCGR_PEP_ID=MMETSP0108-20121206/47258_1 /TAXON_ID=195067 ORGANISM="Goniomonas pacifica, Strain CCMP1869" /NCGR_SAMPLE_ID=MMETSP0108 /ASSEMBLY_ACC=CAM_ASM_000204 /LENGTH=308 /DNA_ID=CAMNT_0017311813 /DNA_START=1 /DNA_END=927 /DNA_ORIENTATION=+